MIEVPNVTAEDGNVSITLPQLPPGRYVLWAGSNSPGIIVSFGTPAPSPISVGTTGTIDIFIHSDSSDVLDAFQATVQITPIGASPASGVRFAAIQSDSQLIDPTYVFAGNSLSFDMATPVGIVNGPGDVFSGFDATLNFVPITLATADMLLFRFDLMGIAAGDYQIGLTSATFVRDQLGGFP